MSIATKTGDKGITSLMFGRRVSKSDPRIAACGACDEVNAALGVARAFSQDSELQSTILTIQKELVTLMGELAVAAEDRERYIEKGFPLVTAAMTDRLTDLVDEIEKNRELRFT